VAAIPAQTQPKRPNHMGEIREVGRTLAAPGAHHPSMAKHTLLRQTPEAGVRCVSSARRDLCGGRGVTRVPTAIEFPRAIVRYGWPGGGAGWRRLTLKCPIAEQLTLALPGLGQPPVISAQGASTQYPAVRGTGAL
jgi:hypothetical protein